MDPSPRQCHAHTLLLLLCTSVLVFLSNNSAFSSAQPGNRSEADHQALLCFKSGISDDPRRVLTSWSADSLSFCGWRGVSCSSSLPLRVLSLELRSVRLHGTLLHNCMANLTSLVRLDLSGNHISGTIPEEVATLPGLQTLMLAGNILSGSIPPSLGAASPSLRYVNLAGNNLSGVIPDSLSKAPSLRVLNLSMNILQGMIPVTIFNSNSSKLVAVDLHWNDLTGPIPSIQKPTSLQFLGLTTNLLSGMIPASLGNVSSLNTILLAENNLSGPIPEALGHILNLNILDLSDNMLSGNVPRFQKATSLQVLGLAQNNLSGRVPASLGNVSSLNTILLAENWLTGSIPEALGHIQNLNILGLSDNMLSGNVPAAIYNVSSFRYLNLGNNLLDGQILPNTGHSLPNLMSLIMRGNRFTGVVPSSLANISKLQEIDLSSNLLNGSVPSLGSLSNLSRLILGSNMLQAEDWVFLTSLTNCSQLSMLSIDGNSLEGSLPESVGNLSRNLERLNFRGNWISGTIPAAIGNLVNLTLLAMDHNMLSGSIPSTIGNLKNLVVLALSTNRLSGEMPSTIGDLPQLNQLYMDDNLLSGNIPASLGQCKRLNMLNLSVNNLDGSIPSEILSISSLSLGLDLSNNNLNGTIPPQIGTLINLDLLNVSNNRLSGEIPTELGQCVFLSYLQMESNMFSGIIPQSLSGLKAIQQMDLSENNLSGQIPEFFESFRTLYHLDLSHNKLVGPIPTSGIFTNSNAVMLEENLGLCQQSAIFALPICPTTSSVTKRKNDARLLLIVAPPATIALLSFLCVLATVTKGIATQPPESFRETMKKVSYGDILKATNWFSPVNKISSSHTASVYVGRFEFDTDLVAIKVFHLDEQGSLNGFFNECEVLKQTRHRNLIQAITLCSTVDFENNEFKALVYEFMANGSLDMWIHPSLHQGRRRRVLSLGQRISIAAEVASALDYLHNQLIPPLIHCDLKPSNVLLDYDMTSRLGDFGSAKFLSSSLTSSSPEGFVGASGTIGYIAPEYGMGCKISTDGDVYGFGVLLLELLTAKRPTDEIFDNDLSLHKYVDIAFPDKIDEILDPQMQNEGEVVCNLRMQNYLIPLVEIGLMCSMESPKDRPGMQAVCAKIIAIQEAFIQTF
ncbi:putative LRR receptor-like serine/threonine-protein kinase [Zea mays]|uniref:Receptor kinase-like protein Xa21 n=1 Tax=Zea mays TaxID=4577 RepID=A0A3L6FC81_MAIZE|nr:putative LRR receptor-like serine/threonine-protein kinase [Zea mays]